MTVSTYLHLNTYLLMLYKYICQQLLAMFLPEWWRPFKHSLTSVTLLEKMYMTKPHSATFRTLSRDFTTFVQYFRNVGFAHRGFHCHVSMQWFTISQWFVYLVPQMACVHQSLSRNTSRQSRSPGGDRTTLRRSCRWWSLINVSTNYRPWEWTSWSVECLRIL